MNAAIVSILPASLTQAGVVDTAAQTLYGAKSFPSGLSAGSVTTPRVTGSGGLVLDSGLGARIQISGGVVHFYSFGGGVPLINVGPGANGQSVDAHMVVGDGNVLQFVKGLYVGMRVEFGPGLNTLWKKAGVFL